MRLSSRTLSIALALAVGALACSPGTIESQQISIRVLPLLRPVLSTSDSYQLEAQVLGTTDTRVEWTGEALTSTGLFHSETAGTFTVVVRSLADPKRDASTSIRVVARPHVELFAAEPSSITAGERATLHWTVDGATQVLLDDHVQTEASVSVGPSATQTYVLTATNEAGLSVGVSATVSVIAAPQIDTFTADHAAVTFGEPDVLSWTTSDATDVRLDGSPVTETSRALWPRATEDHVLEARNALGFVVARTVRIEVAPSPQIIAFYADAANVTAGEATGVRWVTQDATQLLLDGVVVTGTNAVLAPTATTDHVLEARNALGFSVSATVHIAVVPAAVIQTFTADLAILTEGDSTTLRWTTTSTAQLRLNGALVTATSIAVTPALTTDYVLEAKNAAGYATTRTIRVTVVAAPVIETFTADAPTLTLGEGTTLRWTTRDAFEVRLDGQLVSAALQLVTPGASTDYVLQARNAAGLTVSRLIHVNVVAAPLISTFTVDVASLTAGESTTLHWTTAATTEVRLNGALVTGTSAAIMPAVTTTYILVGKNAAGTTVTKSVQVTVVPAPVIATFTTARTPITQSESTLLSWSASNATTVLLNGAVVAGSSLSVAPSTTTAYTLEARNSIGGSVTASLTITVVPQVALNFAASSTSFVVGTGATLTWNPAGAVTLTLNGVAASGSSLAVNPIRSTSYELRATNSLGFESVQSLTLTVAPYPGTIWVAAGQVWLRWTDIGPISGTQTYDVYRSTSPINTLATATLVGRLLPDDVRATRLKLASPGATWMLPLAAGGTTALPAGEAHFTWTPRTAETSFFAVVPSGSSSPQMRFGPIDETISPITAHVQRSGVDGPSGLAYSDYALWLDGRAGADTGRTDFPVMGPASFNGLAALFRVYASPTAGGAMPGLLVLHGSGGNWLDHRPVASNDSPDVRLSKGIVAALDDAFAYTSGTTVSVGTTRWFGSWDGFDRFNPALTLPPNSATVYAYTLRRILWIRDWMIANKGVDPDRVLIAGHSMGALGALTATRAFPDKFAGTLAYQCHTNVVAGFGDFLRGTEAQNLTTSLGASIIDVHDPAVLLAPGDLPPVHIIWGTTDNMIPWADKPVTIAQLSAAKRGPQIWWDERTHGYPWTGHFVGSVGLRAEALVKLKRNQSYPAFSAEVSTAASTSNPWGTQGGYLEWDSDSIAETASQWSVDLWLRGSATLAADLPTFATVTVDVSIRRPQSFLPSAGSTRNWTLRRISDNALLQSGTLTVSPAGLVTAPALVIPKDPQRVRLTVGP